MEKPTSLFNNFTGSIEDLLNHVDKADANEVEQVVCNDANKMLSQDEALALIMEEGRVSKEDARRILDEIMLEEVQQTLNDLINRGLIEVVSYNADGEAVYLPTELGKATLGDWKTSEGGTSPMA